VQGSYSVLYCGLGSVNPHCRVNHWGFNNPSAEASWSNTAWKGFGPSTTKWADEAIQVMFQYDSIEPGATVQFNYAYVLGQDDLRTAMSELEYVTITQPTDIASGNNVLFASEIDLDALKEGGDTIVRSISEVKFQAFGTRSGSKQWHDVGATWSTGSGVVPSANSNGKYEFRTLFDANAFNEGAGQLKATYTLDNGDIFMAAIVVEFVNGVGMCWDLNNDGVGENFDYTTTHTLTMGENNYLQVTPPPMPPPLPHLLTHCM